MYLKVIYNLDIRYSRIYVYKIIENSQIPRYITTV